MIKVSYSKLWKLLIDKDMKKIHLRNLCQISDYNIGRLTRNENVTVDLLAKICIGLKCSLDDIVEISEDETEIQ